MSTNVYRFGDFRLDPATRALQHNDQARQLPRLTFDGLVFLVENRDRAVSRDELIAAVWGRSHVEDIQVTQLIMRLRRALSDDSHAPQYIGTVPGFGYRWIACTDASVHADGSEGTAPDGTVGRAGVPGDKARRYGLMTGLAVLPVLVLVFIAGRVGEREAGELPPLSRAPGQAVAVLPLEVRASGNDAGWVRLGVMDLIAGRLRDAGLPTSPSDSVISALYAAAELPDIERDDVLRRALGAEVLVHGTATPMEEHWTVELIATTADGEKRRVEAGPVEIIPAAGRAADMLLAALGHAVHPSHGEDDSAQSELLQRARAAMLALEQPPAAGQLARRRAFHRRR